MSAPRPLRIGYIARHGQAQGNDDEGAITHALTSLGHNVQRVQEAVGQRATKIPDVDFYLFHKWEDYNAILTVKDYTKRPLVFWYFDLVDYPDSTVEARCRNRRNWMQAVTPMVSLGFCTDGDWVVRDTTGKLIRLTQGADDRLIGVGNPTECPVCRQHWNGAKILFTGTKNGGRQRFNCISELETRYGRDFLHVTNVYQRALADLIAGTQVVIAPQGPVTDRYWSNRVYITTGFGGFLLHPYAKTLAEQYTPDREIVFYRSIEELHAKIDYYLEHPEERQTIAAQGLARTIREHTYTHRCKVLVETVRTRCNL